MTNTTEKKGGAVGAVIGTAVLVIVSAVGGWIAGDVYGRMTKKSAAVGMPPAAPETVATMVVTNLPYNLPEQFVAHAEALQEVDLLPQVDGYVKEILFKEGDLVKEGQVLYRLDDERYQAVVNQRKADLESAEAEARRAERYWERMQKADARGITQLERDNAEAGADTARAAVLQAKANLVVAEYDCKKAQVVAPISGQIGKTTAHVGDYVAPSKGALARIVQVDPIRVSFPLTDRAYVAWRQAERQNKLGGDDHRMRLILPDGSSYDREGAFDFDDNQMSLTTATIMMRLRFPNPDRLLVPNSYVTLLADKKAPPLYPTVQQTAIVDLPQGGVGVYVVKEDGTVEARAVKTLPVHDGLIPIVEGVKAGETVVTSGTRKLRDGAKVVLATPTSNEENDPNYEPTKL